MTDDQQFWVAMVTVLVPTVVAALGVVQGRQTHSAVNGIVAKSVRRARAQGRAQGSVRRAAQQRAESGDGPSKALTE